MAKIGFSSKGKEKMNDFSVIPKGKYIAEITKSENKPTSAKDGSYLNLTLKIIEGEYSGRFLFARLNLDNKDPQTVEFAEKELNTIVIACGKEGEDIEDSDELHGIPMEVTIKIKPANGNFDESNEIKMYDPAPGYSKPTNPDSESSTEEKSKGSPAIEFDE